MQANRNLTDLTTEQLLLELASREMADAAPDASIKNPAHEAAAHRIAEVFDHENYRRQNDPENKLSVIKGEHVPIHWRLMPDGVTLRVVLKSGPQLHGPLKDDGTLEKIIKKTAQALKELTSTDERAEALDAKEADLKRREDELQHKLAEVKDKTPGITDDDEATAAAKALQSRKDKK